ncbi:MAG: hypothetical protein PHI32_07845 [Dysgonamonadaceae bacterium]|nr:hypothetical protein [Dysgonamonadaceae bacterium]MDD4727875.1 hypothetical protein [Dysgonamonadaceae bacterium]
MQVEEERNFLSQGRKEELRQYEFVLLLMKSFFLIAFCFAVVNWVIDESGFF